MLPEIIRTDCGGHREEQTRKQDNTQPHCKKRAAARGSPAGLNCFTGSHFSGSFCSLPEPPGQRAAEEPWAQRLNCEGTKNLSQGK